MSRNDQFTQAMREAEIPIKQQEFFEEWMALRDHSHVAEEIIGLEETVAELVEEGMSNDNEEEVDD